MLEAKLVHSSLFKKIIDSMKELVKDVNFDCSPTGMYLQAMDSAHISLVCLLIEREGFEFYRCDNNISMGINLPTLSKMLKCSGNDDTITIKSHDLGETVTITLESQTGERTTEFDLKLIDINSDKLDIPETNYTAVVKLPSSEFARISKDLASIGDTVTVSINDTTINFSASGPIGEANIILRQKTSENNQSCDVSIAVQEPVSMGFAVRYFNSFAKATSLSENVVVSMRKDLPMVVEYKIKDIGNLRFFLAPRVMDEDLDNLPC